MLNSFVVVISLFVVFVSTFVSPFISPFISPFGILFVSSVLGLSCQSGIEKDTGGFSGNLEL